MSVEASTHRNAAPAAVPFDVAAVRAQFPILGERVRSRSLVYLDNAATTQKPTAVIEALSSYYEHDNANVHRGVHALSERATTAYEGARTATARFLGADPTEIVFTRGTTEAINLVANAWGGANIGEGDEIVLTAMEHHSDIVPWQMLRQRTGAVIKVAPISDAGELDLDALRELVTERTQLVGCVFVSNALGTINPVAEVIRIAHDAGAKVLLDAAQAVAHVPIDVHALDADFLAFSGHKLYGPTGIGALYGKADLLKAMPPWQGGGEMILSVTWDKTTYNRIPHKFEAGTPNIAGAVGLGTAIDWLRDVGLEAAADWEQELGAYAAARLQEIEGLCIVGTAEHKVGVFSFLIDGIHPHDIGTIVDRHGVAIRTGHHCTQPLMKRFGIPATARASLAAYNTREDVDRLVEALRAAREVLA